MIATHIPKFLNARLKQPALRAAIAGQIPPGLLHSGSVKMRQKYWAAPLNAADQKTVRAEIAALPADAVLPTEIPGLCDGRAKQLLMPRGEWRNDDYLSISPVTSAGVMHEVTKRLYERNLPFRRWLIQPIPAAWSNHGEVMATQGGAVRLIRRGVISVGAGSWRGDYCAIRARVHAANISSGMLSVGWPSITSIGGLVHTLERATGQDIHFAVGMQRSRWVDGVRATHRMDASKKNPVPGYVTDEIMGDIDIVILLSAADLDPIEQAAENITRITGGSVHDFSVSVHRNEPAPYASYTYHVSAEGDDALTFALDKYSDGGSWTENHGWMQSGNGHTLTICGYALLELPKARTLARGGYRHAWAEPVFSVVGQSGMSDECWWRRSRSGAFFGYTQITAE